jgi:hypothetical protein
MLPDIGVLNKTRKDKHNYKNPNEIHQFTKKFTTDTAWLYRYLIDDFLIERHKKFHKKDFFVVTDFMMRLKMGKRIHLCEYETDSLAEGLNILFENEVDIPRIKHGKKQTLDTLISEEALLLAKFLRNERKDWNPRIPLLEDFEKL